MKRPSSSWEIPILPEDIATDARDGFDQAPYMRTCDGYASIPTVLAFATFEGGTPSGDAVGVVADVLLRALDADTARGEDE